MRPEPEEIGKKRGVKPLFLMVLMEDENGFAGVMGYWGVKYYLAVFFALLHLFSFFFFS